MRLIRRRRTTDASEDRRLQSVSIFLEQRCSHANVIGTSLGSRLPGCEKTHRKIVSRENRPLRSRCIRFFRVRQWCEDPQICVESEFFHSCCAGTTERGAAHKHAASIDTKYCPPNLGRYPCCKGEGVIARVTRRALKMRRILPLLLNLSHLSRFACHIFNANHAWLSDAKYSTLALMNCDQQLHTGWQSSRVSA